MKFHTAKHTEDGVIKPWSCLNVTRWNKRQYNAHMRSVLAWADRCAKAHPPEKFKATVVGEQFVKLTKIGVPAYYIKTKVTGYGGR